MEETILSDGFLEHYIQRCQTDNPQEKEGRRKQHKSVEKELHQVEQRMENLITALADASLPTLEVSRRYKKEEAEKKELEARLSKQKTVVTDFKVGLEKFRHLMWLELRREETRKATLHALIKEIVAHPNYTMEVKYRIGKNDPVEPTSYPHESRYAHGGPNPGNFSLLLSSNMAILSRV